MTLAENLQELSVDGEPEARRRGQRQAVHQGRPSTGQGASNWVGRTMELAVVAGHAQTREEIWNAGSIGLADPNIATYGLKRSAQQ